MIGAEMSPTETTCVLAQRLKTGHHMSRMLEVKEEMGELWNEVARRRSGLGSGRSLHLNLDFTSLPSFLHTRHSPRMSSILISTARLREILLRTPDTGQHLHVGIRDRSMIKIKAVPRRSLQPHAQCPQECCSEVQRDQ